MNQPVLVSFVRTPMGKLLKAFANYPATKLGAVAIKEAVKRIDLAPELIEHVLMGQVITAGCAQNPARQAAIYAGLPVSIGAVTVNKVCGSSLMAVVWAAQTIKAGDYKTVVAGGMENMSMAPYLIPKARGGYRYGNAELIDSMHHDGLYDIYNDFAMGMTGEIIADRFDISREEMDKFAYRSHNLAAGAMENGTFTEEIVPVEVPTQKGTRTISQDEGPRKDTSIEALTKLKPVFKKDGRVTAGNASPISDGASATIVMDEDFAKDNGIPILARIVDYGTSATKPEWVMEAPIEGVKNLLNKSGLSIKDLDLVEHNEAFASASCAVQNELKIPDEIFNIKGGAVALGHPLGASGARILTTLYYGLVNRQKKRGLATICLGGGESVSMIIERP
ncbi:MAG: thiolase family protein [Candidatus Heimdallarchaeota archaeon]